MTGPDELARHACCGAKGNSLESEGLFYFASTSPSFCPSPRFCLDIRSYSDEGFLFLSGDVQISKKKDFVMIQEM